MKECGFKNRNQSFIPKCEGKVTHYLVNYYSKIIPPATDRHMYLCQVHAKWHRQINPFSGIEIKEIKK